jgi:hypothetical protein
MTTDLPMLASSLVCGASIDHPHFLALCRIANPLIVNHRRDSSRQRDISRCSRTFVLAGKEGSKATFDLLPSSKRSAITFVDYEIPAHFLARYGRRGLLV